MTDPICWIFLLIVTALRIAIASLGHCGEAESYLMLCAQRFDCGFVEGPAGVPALIKISGGIFGMTPLGVRFFSPLMMLIASWMLWQLTRSLFQDNKKIAAWSVIAFNFLPLANAAAIIMDGTMVEAGCWITAVAASWRVLSIDDKKTSLPSWIFLGLLLAVETQFSYAIGWILPVVFLWGFSINRFSFKNILARIFHTTSLRGAAKLDGNKECDGLQRRRVYTYRPRRNSSVTQSPSGLRKPQQMEYEIFGLGMGSALGLLLLGWISPLWWNMHHDMLQWREITWGAFWSWETPAFAKIYESPLFWFMPFLLPFLLAGMRPLYRHRGKHRTTGFLTLVLVPLTFYIGALGHGHAGLPSLLAVTALLLPGAVSLFLKNSVMKKIGVMLLIIAALFSSALLLGILPPSPHAIWNLPSTRGVAGVQKVAVELLRLRTTERDAAGHPPFIIAQTPGLAALVGMSLPITYPELTEAPPIFIPESPAFTSQFQLWPNYADATATAVVDPLYTEEKTTSPFLGRNALYLTEESAQYLPETISRAFGKITPVSHVPLETDHQKKLLTIYLCENYQMMTL